MIILDTNVLSEILRPSPDETVARWLAAREPSDTFTTAISQAEMLSGVEVLPAGRRKKELATAIKAIFAEEFAGRILSFDEEVAPFYASIVAAIKRAGRPISQFDAMIAASALKWSATLATRNTGDFSGCGVRLVNPWSPVKSR